MALYLIKRGPKPEYHRAPFHPVILCDRKRIAMWEASWSGSQAWVWARDGLRNDGQGWLLQRWNGLDIDYGHVVRDFVLPDGNHAAFYRDYEPFPQGIQDLFAGAVWWSDKRMPAWLQERGVIYPPDAFTQQWILDHIADDGLWNFGREVPPYWPAHEPDEGELHASEPRYS